MNKSFSMPSLAMLVVVLALQLHASGQKFAYIDSDYVLLHMQEYADAQKDLNQMSLDWQAEIEEKIAAVDRLETAYRAERILLTPEMRAKREEEIEAKRAEAKALQKEKFGVEGELFRQRQELIQPIQDQIFEEIKELANNSQYSVIFDKSNQSNMLYTNPKYDVSDKLIKALGYVPGETIEGENEEKGEGGLVGKAKEAGNKGREAIQNGVNQGRDAVRGAVTPRTSRTKD
ncbi:MAG: OmpH family outer membrane protein [Flavobacteriales bacterium]